MKKRTLVKQISTFYLFTFYLFHFFGRFNVIAREFFQGACDHFLVTVMWALGTVRLILGMELLTIYSLSEVDSEH